MSIDALLVVVLQVFLHVSRRAAMETAEAQKHASPDSTQPLVHLSGPDKEALASASRLAVSQSHRLVQCGTPTKLHHAVVLLGLSASGTRAAAWAHDIVALGDRNAADDEDGVLSGEEAEQQLKKR